MSDYLPINSNSLRTDTKIGCDLYLLVETSSGSRYILYCRGDAVFENAKREMLVGKNTSRFLLKKKTRGNTMITWKIIFKTSYPIQGFLPMKRQKSCIARLQTWLKTS